MLFSSSSELEEKLIFITFEILKLKRLSATTPCRCTILHHRSYLIIDIYGSLQLHKRKIRCRQIGTNTRGLAWKQYIQ